MAIAEFRVKYPRPVKLPDQNYDYSSQAYDTILATPDNELGLQDYKALLRSFFPAGTYEELVYFLPGVFRYFLAHEDQALDLFPALIRFVCEFKARLKQDEYLAEVRACLRECLDYLTRDFRVIHFDNSAYRKKGSRAKYFDYVENADAVAKATCELTECEGYEDVAVEFVRDLAYHGNNSTKAAWFLEYTRSKHDIYHPPDYEPITGLINDRMLLKRAAELVSEQRVPNEPSPTYWRDTFKSLNIDWSIQMPDEKQHNQSAYPKELKNYMDAEGHLTDWPSPRNKKGLQRIALEYLASKFEFDRTYTEKEVNAILKQFHTFGDHALLRRELYDKRFFNRKVDGTAYWRMKPSDTNAERSYEQPSGTE